MLLVVPATGVGNYTPPPSSLHLPTHLLRIQYTGCHYSKSSTLLPPPLSNLNSPVKLNIFKATKVTHVTNSNKVADRVDHKHILEAFALPITRWTLGTWLPSKVLLSVHLHNFYCRHMHARCRECCCQVASHNCSCNTMFLVSVVNTMSLVALLASPLSGATRPFRSIRQLVFLMVRVRILASIWVCSATVLLWAGNICMAVMSGVGKLIWWETVIVVCGAVLGGCSHLEVSRCHCLLPSPHLVSRCCYSPIPRVAMVIILTVAFFGYGFVMMWTTLVRFY